MTVVGFTSVLNRYEVARLRKTVDGEPESRPLGIIHVNEYMEPGPRFGPENVLLCSYCERPAVNVCLIPWCVLVNEIQALCLECSDEPSGYSIGVEDLRTRWNETIMHLAEKRSGGGVVELLRWFSYSGLCKFLGFDNLAKWPIARGVITPEIRAEVLERDGNRCRRCPATEHLTIDHIRPVSAGGFTTMTNLQVLCQSCNSRKGGVRRKHPKARVGRTSSSVAMRATPLGDQAAELLVDRSFRTSVELATSLGMPPEYVNRVLRADPRFRCLLGGGRGCPSQWALAENPAPEPTPC